MMNDKLSSKQAGLAGARRWTPSGRVFSSPSEFVRELNRFAQSAGPRRVPCAFDEFEAEAWGIPVRRQGQRSS